MDAITAPEILELAALGFQPEQRPLLQAIVATAKAVFGAQASSIFLLSSDGSELIFEAVAGRGEEKLVGSRVATDRGIAGWVLSTGQPIVVDDLSTDALFDQETAKATGFVPSTIIAAPVFADDVPIGVVEVLDRTADRRGSLSDLDILSLMAHQASAALQVIRRARAADAMGTATHGYQQVASMLTMLDEMDEQARATVRKLLVSMTNLVTSLVGQQPLGP